MDTLTMERRTIDDVDCWIVRGPEGAVVFQVGYWPDGRAQPRDVGYHGYGRVRDSSTRDLGWVCQFLGDAPCWYDGSGLAAARYWESYQAGGDHVVFARLAGYYNATFSTDRTLALPVGVRDA